VPVEGSGVYRINGNLAVARAVGDRSERPFVSADCEVKVFDGDKGKMSSSFWRVTDCGML